MAPPSLGLGGGPAGGSGPAGGLQGPLPPSPLGGRGQCAPAVPPGGGSACGGAGGDGEDLPTPGCDMTGDLPATPLARVSHSQPDLAVLDMAAHLARTTLARGAPPPRGTLADLVALGAYHGMDER
eukprot:15450694-Alexandrium_andersonii.AAC.1